MSSESAPKNEFIGFEADSELKEEAQRAAERDGRSLSNYMRHLLRRQLEIERRLFGEDRPHNSHAA